MLNDSYQVLEWIVRQTHIQDRLCPAESRLKPAAWRAERKYISGLELLHKNTFNLRVIHIDVLAQRIQDELHNIVDVSLPWFRREVEQRRGNPVLGCPVSFWKRRSARGFDSIFPFFSRFRALGL